MGDTAAMTSAQASNLQEASMATSAFSSISNTVGQVNAIKAQGSYQSTIANTNAALAKLKASQTLEAGDIAASRRNLQTQSQVGTARATAGASGVDVNSGSPAMIQSDIRTVGGIDEATIRSNAQRQAWGFQTQALEDTFQGQFASLTAKSKTAQTIATGGLSAISGPLGMYAQSELWKYRYGLKGTPGQPFPGGGTSSGATSDDSDFWGAG